MKVFVANPKKPPQIESILRRNKDKLLVFLKDFHNDKEGEWQRPVDDLRLTDPFADEQFTVCALCRAYYDATYNISRTRSNS